MVISSAAIFGPQRLRISRSTSNKICPGEVWRGERGREILDLPSVECRGPDGKCIATIDLVPLRQSTLSATISVQQPCRGTKNCDRCATGLVKSFLGPIRLPKGGRNAELVCVGGHYANRYRLASNVNYSSSDDIRTIAPSVGSPPSDLTCSLSHSSRLPVRCQ